MVGSTPANTCMLQCRGWLRTIKLSDIYPTGIDDTLFLLWKFLSRKATESLSILNLANNRLTLLPEHLLEPVQQSLQWFGMQHNGLQSLAVAQFEGLSKLAVLLLDNNRLYVLYESSHLFPSSSFLHHLYFIPFKFLNNLWKVTQDCTLTGCSVRCMVLLDLSRGCHQVVSL